MTVDTRLIRGAVWHGISTAIPRSPGPGWTLERTASVFDEFMAAAPVVAFVKDPDGRYLFVNQPLLELFGDHLGSDWFGKTDADIWPPDVAAMVRRSDAAALAADAPVQVIQGMPVGDRLVQIQVTKFPIRTSHGLLLGGIGLDISQHVRTTEGLKRAHVLLATASEIGGVTAWELDPAVWAANPKVGSVEFLGSDSEVTSLDQAALVKLVHPQDLDRVVALLLAACRDGHRFDEEFRIAMPGGAVRWMHASGRLVPGDSVTAGRIVGVALDVTERRAASASLRTQAAILANVQDAIVVTDVTRRITYWNDGATRIFGYTNDEIIGRPLTDIYPHRDVGDLARIEEPGASFEFDGEREATRKDGSPVAVHLRVRLMQGPDGAVTGAVALATDVTKHRDRDRELQRLSTAVEQSANTIVITDAEGRIQYVNPAFEQSTGYRHDEVLGENPRILKSGVQSTSFYAAMWATLTSGQTFVADMTNRRKDGSHYQEEAVISPIRDEEGRITSYVAVKRDVTHERALEAAAARASHERALIADTLANLTAQATSEATAQMICRRVATMSGVVSAAIVWFADRDHATPLGMALANGRRVRLRPTPEQRSLQLLERAKQGPWIEAWVPGPRHPYDQLLNGLGVRAQAYAPVTYAGVTTGLLIVGSAESDAGDVLAENLPALVEFAGLTGALIGQDLATRATSLRERQHVLEIIERLAFHPVFQAIVDLKSDRIIGYEALSRFDDGTAPEDQFAAAEAVGLGVELEEVTVRAAIVAAGCLDPHLLLNLNASPAFVMAGAVMRSLVQDVRQPVVLEITEHLEIADYEAFHRAMGALGPSVRLAVDDAGAGFASLRHILELHPAFVKLDRSLVAGIDSDPARLALAAGLQQFARSTGARLIAEGVETERERSALLGLGIRLAQGYLLGRPGPLPD